MTPSRITLTRRYRTLLPLPAVVSAASPGTATEPGPHSTPVPIGAGASPALAIDAARRTAHLVGRDSPRLLCRIGNLAGRFGDPEPVFTGPPKAPARWDPRTVPERGEKVVAAHKPSDRSAPRGDSHRPTPCVAAHPDGGIAVFFQETTSPDRFFSITVGAPGPEEPGPRPAARPRTVGQSCLRPSSP